MIEKDEFFQRAGIEFAVFAQFQIDLRFSIGLLAGIDAKNIGFILHGPRDRVAYRSQDKVRPMTRITSELHRAWFEVPNFGKGRKHFLKALNSSARTKLESLSPL